MQHKMIEAAGQAARDAPAYNTKFWDDRGSWMQAPNLKTVTELGASVAGTLLGGAPGALLAGLATDALFTSLDVNSGMDAGMSWGGFGVRSAIQVATFGINQGFNKVGEVLGPKIAGLVAAHAGDFGQNAIGSTLLKGTEIMTTNMATSAISSMDFSAIGKKNFFDSGSFTKGAFGKNAMTSVAVGMAGSLAQGASGDYLKKITNSSDNTKFLGLTGMIGNLTSIGTNYGLTGNAQVNLLNTNMFASMGLRDSHGKAVNTGLFELSFGKDGVHGSFGMGGTDVSAGTIAGALSDVQSAYGEYKKVEAAKQAAVLQSMIRDMNFSNTGNNARLQIGADTAGKDALDKMNPVSDEDGKLPGFINPFAKQNGASLDFIGRQSQNLADITNDARTPKSDKSMLPTDVINNEAHKLLDPGVEFLVRTPFDGSDPEQHPPKSWLGGAIEKMAHGGFVAALKGWYGVNLASLLGIGINAGAQKLPSPAKESVSAVGDVVGNSADLKNKAKEDQIHQEGFALLSNKPAKEIPRKKETKSEEEVNATELKENAVFVADHSGFFKTFDLNLKEAWDTKNIVNLFKEKAYGGGIGIPVNENLIFGAQGLMRMVNPSRLFDNYSSSGSAYRFSISSKLIKPDISMFASYTSKINYINVGVTWKYTFNFGGIK